MATRYLHKLLSIFYRQPIREGNVPSFRTVNGVFGDWATSAVEDVPPPYTESPESQAHFPDDKQSPPPPFECPCLQVCPHETLSFENLQKIATSVAIDNETIDALTSSCHEHRSQFDLTSKKTKSTCVSSPGLLKGSGVYIAEESKDPAHGPGVALCFQWDLGFLDGIRGQVETAAELHQFLGAEVICLCQHKRISDSDVVNAIFGFIKRPSGHDVVINCERCETEITVFAGVEGDDQMCRVTTKRYLGAARKPDDPVWLAQCDI